MKYLLILYLLLFLASPAAVSLLLRKIPGVTQPSDSQTIYFHSEKDYQGSFTSPKDKLISVSIKMKNAFRNSDPLIFSLYEGEIKIQELQVSGSNINDGAWARFVFPEIVNSKDKTYNYTLKSKTTDIGHALGIYTTDKGIPALITYHRVNSYPQTALQIYTNLGQHLLQDKPFLIFWGVIITFCFYLLRKTSTSSFS